MAYKQIVNMGGNTVTMDVIEYEGGGWLVPQWLVSPDKKTMRPARIISLRMSGIESPAPRVALAFFQNDIWPESLFLEGVIPPDKRQLLLVHENPDIEVPNPDVTN